MATSEPVSVRHNPRLARWLLGGAAAFTALWLLTLAITPPGLVYVLGPAVLLLALGALYRRRTYFTYEPDTGAITLRAPAGPAYTRYELDPGGHLAYDGTRIVAIHPDRQTTKLPVRRARSHPDDWNAVVAGLPTV